MWNAPARKVTQTTRRRAGTTSAIIPSRRRADVRRRLLRWYDRHRRDLPWRRRVDDPYAQWVAEVMLQQTRVGTVAEYYERFLHRFPDVCALASARREDVLKYWEGLGYYKRALHLHQAARQLRHSDRTVPSTVVELRRMPGVGEYTAAAVASIAGGERVAAVDGNVARVIARLFGVEDDVLSPTGKARVCDLASQLLPAKRPGDFNQAWMDLGSAVCTPKSPECRRCPLRSVCRASATGQAESLPVRGDGRRSQTHEVSSVVGIFVRGRTMLASRRPEGGLWSGLWEFPNVEVKNRSAQARTLRRLAQQCEVALVSRSRRVGVVSHQLTHRLFKFHVYVVAAEPNGAPSQTAGLRWVSVQAFARLPVSTAHRRAFQTAQETISALMR